MSPPVSVGIRTTDVTVFRDPPGVLRVDGANLDRPVAIVEMSKKDEPRCGDRRWSGGGLVRSITFSVENETLGALGEPIRDHLRVERVGTSGQSLNKRLVVMEVERREKWRRLTHSMDERM